MKFLKSTQRKNIRQYFINSLFPNTSPPPLLRLSKTNLSINTNSDNIAKIWKKIK